MKKIYAPTRKSPAKTALNGIDLQIPRGCIFGLLGANGAGKSTLINILAGLTVKTAGYVEILGCDQDKDPRLSRSYIGIMPQEINFDPFLSPLKSLETQAGLFGLTRKERRTKEILDMVGLLDKAHSYTRALSGGMKRRLLLAKALVHNPAILVLDEPTAGVDVELRKMLWENIAQLNAAGMTIILTTHYLHEAEELCDKIAIIDHGALIAESDTDALIRQIDQKSIAITVREKTLDADALLAKITAPQGASVAYRDADCALVFTYNRSKNAAEDILQSISRAGLTIQDVTSEDPNLEDIFIKLTKKRPT